MIRVENKKNHVIIARDSLTWFNNSSFIIKRYKIIGQRRAHNSNPKTQILNRNYIFPFIKTLILIKFHPLMGLFEKRTSRLKENTSKYELKPGRNWKPNHLSFRSSSSPFPLGLR